MTKWQDKSTLNDDYDYIVVGAGPAGVTAAETLAKNSKGKTILLIGGEDEPPYSRMAIPYLLVGKVPEAGTYLRKDSNHYQGLGIEYANLTVSHIDEKENKLHVQDERPISFGKCCLATGSHPIRPPIPGLDRPQVQHCWTLEDARAIMKLAQPNHKVVLMGAGFIGCIILEALVKRKVGLSVVEMGDRMVPRMLDDTCGNLLKSWCVQQGVEVYTSTKIMEAQDGKDGHALAIHLDNDAILDADLLVVAAGVRANMDMVANSSITTGNGIRVNEYMQTSIADIYAAGDVAEAKDFNTNEWQVHAIQPVAADHGKIAALNMMGIKTAYSGSMGLNVLDTLGLISASFGKWDGVSHGSQVQRLDADAFRYTALQFEDDILIGAQILGRTNEIGVIRGLIENRTPLGTWKDKLLQDPNQIMHAYIDISHPD